MTLDRPAAAEPERNLILIHTREWQDPADFATIKRYIEDQAPDIQVFIASNDIPSSATRKIAASRPTLIFSPLRLLHFKPARGKVYAGARMSKLAEMRRLAAGGMPIPEFEVIEPDTRLSEKIYGPLVVTKPSYDLASHGQGVVLFRTPHVEYRPPESFPPNHPGRQAPMIAQKFIDCGYPMTCRVLTFFGEPILTFYRQSTKPLSLPADKDRFQQSEYMPSLPDRITYSTREPDILQLAADAYRAMPEVALQACDIIRERGTGRLYLLEINPGGGTWMFSNSSAEGYRKALGVTDLTLEFDAFRTVARVLVERTRAEAE
ncbi:MAG: hypothetical protein K2Z80_04165 [Xanthobacteraceae bacterium]|nr:hypothetical protein [Xanthobacteraceae bacterium]